MNPLWQVRRDDPVRALAPEELSGSTGTCVFASVGDRLTAVQTWKTPTHWIAYPRAVFG